MLRRLPTSSCRRVITLAVAVAAAAGYAVVGRSISRGLNSGLGGCLLGRLSKWQVEYFVLVTRSTFQHRAGGHVAQKHSRFLLECEMMTVEAGKEREADRRMRGGRADGRGRESEARRKAGDGRRAEAAARGRERAKAVGGGG